MKKIFHVVVATLVLIGCSSGSTPAGNIPEAPEAPKAAPTGWQAIFLNNGQIYYGHLAKTNNNFYILKDIYIIQMIHPPQGGKDQAPRPRLIKFGNEVLGQVEELEVNKDQILFIQELGADSKVVQAINQIKSGSLTGSPMGGGEGGSPPPVNNSPPSPKSETPKGKPEAKPEANKGASEGQHGVR